MDKNLQKLHKIHIEKTIKALNKNNFNAHFVNSKQALIEILEKEIPQNSMCTVGGSMTLFECGIIDLLKNGDYNYLDRYAQNADIEDIYRKAFFSDVYLTSTNAVTMDGKLFNIDGRGNRVSPMIFGPKKVIVIAGMNKIVSNLEEAKKRLRKIAAPANCIRLNIQNPCTKTGECMDCNKDISICISEVVLNGSRDPNRYSVYILPENYGY